MSEFVNLVEIQYRKRTRMKQKTSDNKFTMVDCTNVKDSFFWIQRHEEFVNNLLAETLAIGQDSKTIEVLENIKEQLLDIYNNALDREQSFLKNLKIEMKIPIKPNIEDYEANRTYAQNFNTIISNEFMKTTDSFKEMINSEEFLDIISPKVSQFSSTAAVGQDGDKQKFFEGLIKIFLEGEEKSKGFYNTFSYKGKGKDEKENAQKLRNMLDSYINFCETYNLADFATALSKELENNNDEIIKLISQQLDGLSITLYNSQKRRISNGLNKGKGISKAFEKDLKTAFKRISEVVIQKSAGALEFGYNYGNGILRIEQRNINSPNDFFFQVSLQMSDNVKINQKATENPLEVLLKFFKEAIPVYSQKTQADEKELIKNFNKNEKKIRDIISRNLQKTEKEQKDNVSIEGQRRILRAYDRNQIKGLMAEIDSALYLQNIGGRKGIAAQVTGAMSVKSGQLNYDVIVKMRDKLYGFQIKNYAKNDSHRYQLYDDESFNISSTNTAKKYFGEDTQKYFYLFANEKMLKELNLVNNFDEEVAQSLYKYSDNFLRIAAGDLNDLDLKTSDAFFIDNKVIPSSYLIATLYESCKNQIKDNERNNPMFYINSNEADYETMQSGVASKIHYIELEKKRLGNTKIGFKGITVDLNF